MQEIEGAEAIEVMVDEVVPSGQNPREDFGDLERLAASIRSTGGQPISPIVVVRDGGRYVLVDGERRWRAMRRLGTKACRALAFRDMSDAEQALGMMATDEKMRLSESERAKGFQLMLALGVPDDVVSDATGVDMGAVRRVRGSRKGAVVETVSMSGLLESAYPEFSEEEQERIRSAESPALAASLIRAHHAQDEKVAAMKAACRGDVEWREGRYADPGEDGFEYLGQAATPERLEALTEPVKGDALVGIIIRALSGDAVTAYLYRAVAESDRTERDRERESARLRADTLNAAYDQAIEEACRWLLGDGRDTLSALAVERRTDYILSSIRKHTLMDAEWMPDHDEAMGSPASMAEMMHVIASLVCEHGGKGFREDGYVFWSTKGTADMLSRCVADGMEPSEAVTDVIDACREAADGDAR